MAKRHTKAPGDFQTLFLRLEELIVASSGADVFDESLKLVAAKLYDERAGTRAFADPSAASLNAALRAAAHAWPQCVPEKPLAVEPAVAVRCAELLKPFSLVDAGEALDALFETLVNATSKGRKGQYFTPRYVVDLCVSLAGIRSDDAVLDPACGSGAFLRAAQAAGARDVRGYDIDERAMRVGKLLTAARGGDPACIKRGDGLRDAAPGSADVILTNPPFAGEIIDAGLLETFTLAKGRVRVERDVLFLESAVRALRAGGTLAMVLPHNKFAGRTTLYVREWLLRETQVLAVIGLGRNTFLPHTHQKANVLLARKRAAPVNGKPERIFFAQSELDGKDTRGTAQAHDLEEIARSYRAFAGAG